MPTAVALSALNPLPEKVISSIPEMSTVMFTRVAEKIVLTNSRTRVVIGVVVCCNGSVWLVILVVISFTSLPWLVELCFVVHDALATSLRTPVGPALCCTSAIRLRPAGVVGPVEAPP